jgi:uncharacterized membrane protein
MKHLENYTPKLMQLNLAFLLSIIFIPFSTSFVFENISSLSNVPFVVYNVTYIIANVFNYFLFSYILNPANSILAPDDQQRMSNYRFEILYSIAVYSLAMAISFVYLPFAGISYAAFGLERFFNKKKKAQLLPATATAKAIHNVQE